MHLRFNLLKWYLVMCRSYRTVTIAQELLGIQSFLTFFLLHIILKLYI